MGDTSLNIRTTIQTAPVTELRKSVKELRDEWNGMSADQRRSPLGKQLAADINQLNQAIKEANPNWNTMRAHIREARSEHRLISLGIVSLTHTMDAFGVQGSKVAQQLQGIAGAGLGVEMAFSAMGPTMAAFAGPAGIAAALVVAFLEVKNALDATNLSAEEIQKRFNELQKTQKTYNDAVAGAEIAKINATTADEFERASKTLGAYKNQLEDATKIYDSYMQTNREYTKEGLEAMQKYYEALKKVSDQEAVLSGVKEKRSRAEEESQYQRFGEETTRLQEENMLRQRGYTGLGGTSYLGSQEIRTPITMMGMGIGPTSGETESKKLLDNAKLIETAFSRVGTSIEQNLVAKLKMGNDLAGQLAQELILSAIQIAGMAASGGAGAGIPGLFMGLVGYKGRSTGTP